ncbi:MAG: hypothetical protein F4X97_01995 [Boseongicola sp. SB0662_bin_57]|nr:hypothetical protein [Boseongicola sp. SB0662_bin_57]
MRLYPNSKSAHQTFVNYYSVDGAKRIKLAADATLSTTTTAARNRQYAANWAVLYEQDATVYGALVKVDAPDRTGWRVSESPGKITASTSKGITARGGVKEGGDTPEASLHTMRELRIDYRTVDRKFKITDTMEALANRRIDDLAVQDINVLRNQTAAEMLKEINRMLVQPMEPIIDAASGHFVDAMNEFTSLDRIVSSVERAKVKQTGSKKNYFNYADMPRDDRASGGVAKKQYDSIVISCDPAAKNVQGEALTETLGELQPRHLKNLKYAIHRKSGRWPTTFIVSSDVQEYLDNMFEGLQRYPAGNTGTPSEIITGPGATQVEFGESGVVPALPGDAAGFQVMSYDGIPFVSSIDETFDTATANAGKEFGHIYGIRSGVEPYSGLPSMFFSRLLPLSYREYSVLNSEYGATITDDHNSLGLFTMKGETWCQVPSAQGVIMNIERKSI